MEAFENTGIWRRTLAEQPNDPDAAPRKLLRDAFMAMRERAKTLVAEIHRDLPTHTVHDITHLDALWEVADLLAGQDFPLTPAEAFVLGGSFLLHDAAMSVASNPGGIAEMRESIEWKDTAARMLGAKHAAIADVSEFARLDAETQGRVVGEVLRLRHAKHAELMGTISWSGPNHNEFLIENSDLLANYGKLIGQIARSHWVKRNSNARERRNWRMLRSTGRRFGNCASS